MAAIDHAMHARALLLFMAFFLFFCVQAPNGAKFDMASRLRKHVVSLEWFRQSLLCRGA
jgi:hypothetical protein